MYKFEDLPAEILLHVLENLGSIKDLENARLVSKSIAEILNNHGNSVILKNLRTELDTDFKFAILLLKVQEFETTSPENTLKYLREKRADNFLVDVNHSPAGLVDARKLRENHLAVCFWRDRLLKQSITYYNKTHAKSLNSSAGAINPSDGEKKRFSIALYQLWATLILYRKTEYEKHCLKQHQLYETSQHDFSMLYVDAFDLFFYRNFGDEFWDAMSIKTVLIFLEIAVHDLAEEALRLFMKSKQNRNSSIRVSYRRSRQGAMYNDTWTNDFEDHLLTNNGLNTLARIVNESESTRTAFVKEQLDLTDFTNATTRKNSFSFSFCSRRRLYYYNGYYGGFSTPKIPTQISKTMPELFQNIEFSDFMMDEEMAIFNEKRLTAWGYSFTLCKYTRSHSASGLVTTTIRYDIRPS